MDIFIEIAECQTIAHVTVWQHLAVLFFVSGARGRLRVMVVELEARVRPQATCSEDPRIAASMYPTTCLSLWMSGCNLKWEFLFSGLASLKFVFLTIDPPPLPGWVGGGVRIRVSCF